MDALDDDGFSVDAWLDQMRLSTGAAGWTRRALAIGTLRSLAAALGDELREVDDKCAGARQLAAEYVERHRGQKIGTYGFIEWIQNSRRVHAVRKASTPVQPVPEGGPEWKIGGG